MSICIHCQSTTPEYPFRVLDIQTLHVRDISGEKYVQAMGETADYAVCRNCAEQYIRTGSSFGKAQIKKLIPFALLIVFGIMYTVVQHTEVLYMRLWGPIAILCGLIGIGTMIARYRSQKNDFAQLNTEDALKKAAWLVLIDSLPKKNGDQDVTYIPVDGRTKGLNVQQLVQTYDLLPAIAKQVKAKLNS